jgi:transposase
MDENTPEAVDGGNGGHGFYRVDLRSLATRREAEGSAPADVARHCRGKKKNDRVDANELSDALRCDFLPECYLAPTAIRERRRTLRYRNLLVRQMVQMKNKIAMLLMEAGVSYNKQRLHQVGYFRELLAGHR